MLRPAALLRRRYMQRACANSASLVGRSALPRLQSAKAHIPYYTRRERAKVRLGLSFLQLPSSARHRLAHIAARRAGIRLRSLTSHRQVLRVTSPTVRFDVSQAPDISADLPAQLPLNGELLDCLAQECFFFW